MNPLDVYVVYKFLKILTTSWQNQPAFKLGIIDAKGKLLKKSAELTTAKERNAYTIFHRLIFNLKRLLEKIPGGKYRIASYAAALYLLKEETNSYSLEKLNECFVDFIEGTNSLNTFTEYLTESTSVLKKGRYQLTQDVLNQHGHFVTKGDYVEVSADQKPKAQVLGDDVYEVMHEKSHTVLMVSDEDIRRA